MGKNAEKNITAWVKIIGGNMNTGLSFKEAKRWSSLVWEYRVTHKSNNLDALIEQYPILESLRNNCGFCEKYSTIDDTRLCGRCPLVINGNGCTELNHPYLLWSTNRTSSNALVMLELIRNAKDPDKNY